MRLLKFTFQSSRNLLRTYRLEGLSGVRRKISRLLWRCRFSCMRSLARILPLSHVTVRGGVRMFPNFEDHTFYLEFTGDNEYLRKMLLRVSKRFCLIDVGANQGYYSLIAAKNPNCLQIFALEPVTGTRKLLAKNVVLNRLSDRIDVLSFGISSRYQAANMQVPKHHSGAATLRESLVKFAYILEPVELKPLRVLEQMVPKECAVFIKIDVEGYEETVIQSFVESGLSNRTEWIFLEVDERWINLGNIVKELNSVGTWDFVRIGDGLHYDILAVKTDNSLSENDRSVVV